jgi:hypothetical protein
MKTKYVVVMSQFEANKINASHMEEEVERPSNFDDKGNWIKYDDWSKLVIVLVTFCIENNNY